MEELRRVILSPKHLLMLVCIVLLSFLFSFEEKPERSNLEEMEMYVDTYNSFYDSMKTSAEEMLTLSIFREEGSFSFRNIQKTIRDYSKVGDWKIKAEDTALEEAFFDFPPYPALLSAYVFMLALLFCETEKGSFWKIVHSSPEGRSAACRKRMGILFFASGFFTLIVYAIRLGTLEVQYGRGLKYGMPIQTIERFQYIPECYTVGDFLIRVILLKVIMMFLVGLLIWLILSLFRSKAVSVFVMLAAMAAELLLRMQVTDGSSLALFKYVNVFTCLEPITLYEQYLNLNLFGYPVNIFTVAAAALPVVVVIAAVCLIIVSEYKYQSSSQGVLEKVIMRLKIPVYRLLHACSFLPLEGYKILSAQKGILGILLLIYCMVSYSGMSTGYLKPADYFANKYYWQFAGQIQDDSLREMEALLEEKQAGMAELSDYNMEDLRGLQRVYETAGYLRSQNPNAVLIPPYAYESILGQENKLFHLIQCGKIMAVIVFLSYGMIAYEKERKMRGLIRSGCMGAGGFFNRKMWLGFFMAMLSAVIFYGQELYSAGEVLSGFSYAGASAGNLLFLEGAADIPIFVLVIQVYAGKILVCGTVYWIAVLLSGVFNRVNHALITLICVFEIPVLLSYFIKGDHIFSMASFCQPGFLVQAGWLLPSGCAVISLLCCMLSRKWFLKKD